MNSDLVSHLNATRRYDLTRRAAERHAIPGASLINRPDSSPKSRRRLARFAR